MPAYFGDYDTTETVIIPFNTFSSNDPSASVTVTDLAASDVEIHKDGGTTQRASDNGVTVSIDFDSVTGNHIVSIDLSDNSDAGFYAAGSRYQVRLEGITVDGATLNVWIGTFSIGCTLRPTTAGRTLDVESGGCAGIDWGDVANKTTANDLSATDIQLCDTVTTNSDMRGTDSAATAAELAKVPKSDGSASWNATALAAIEGECQDAIEGNNLDHLLKIPVSDESELGDEGGNEVVASTIMALMLANSGDAGDYNYTTDALEAIRDKLTDIETDTAEIGAAGVGLTEAGGDGDHLTEAGGTGDQLTAVATAANLATAQADLDTITGADGVTLATAQGNYAPAKAGDAMDLVANAVDATSVATGAIDADALAADAVTEIWAKAMSDLAAGAPSATCSVLTAINYLYEAWRNKTETTSSEIAVYKDDGSTKLTESDISDDGTTFTKGEYGAVD